LANYAKTIGLQLLGIKCKVAWSMRERMQAVSSAYFKSSIQQVHRSENNHINRNQIFISENQQKNHKSGIINIIVYKYQAHWYEFIAHNIMYFGDILVKLLTFEFSVRQSPDTYLSVRQKFRRKISPVKNIIFPVYMNMRMLLYLLWWICHAFSSVLVICGIVTLMVILVHCIGGVGWNVLGIVTYARLQDWNET
jgi:hypothetical protein